MLGHCCPTLTQHRVRASCSLGKQIYLQLFALVPRTVPNWLNMSWTSFTAWTVLQPSRPSSSPPIQSQIAVTACLWSKQLPLFVFALRRLGLFPSAACQDRKRTWLKAEASAGAHTMRLLWENETWRIYKKTRRYKKLHHFLHIKMSVDGPHKCCYGKVDDPFADPDYSRF